MDIQHPERKNRIKLRVLTSTGLNLLCTANRSQKIKELLPHIIKLYEEVKEDQGLNDHQNKVTKPFIKFIRKQEFLIAPSELVGDIFDDNDEVFCEIADEAILNLGVKTSKKQKQIKEQDTVKSENKPSKTKKIKKKNLKQQSQQLKDNKKSQKPVKKTQVVEQNQPISTEKVDVQVENNGQVKEPLSTENKQNIPENQVPKEGKKKKNKNNNKKQSEQKASLPKEQKQEVQPKTQKVHQKLHQGLKPNVKKVQPSKQKSNIPLLSNDELAKFRQLMKKSTPIENNQ